MNRIHQSSPFVPPRVMPFPGDNMLEASPAYSPVRPGSTRVPNCPQPETGLGISHCEVEVPFSQLRLYPPSETHSLPVSSWSGQMLPPDPFYGNTMNVGTFLSVPYYYEPYGGRTSSDSNNSPLSLCSAQTLGTSPAYSPGVDLGRSHDSTHGQFLDVWSTAPRSGATTPLKEELDEHWDPLFIPNTHEPTIPVLPQVPQITVENTTLLSPLSPLSPPLPDEITRGGFLDPDSDPNADRILDRNRRVTIHEFPFPTGSVIRTTDNNNNSSSSSSSSSNNKSNSNGNANGDSGKTPRRRRLSSASGLQCTICGFQFTRRSNCQEHMKRHDPGRKRAHSCEFCGRPFGRRTDLKRHMDSIHYNVRNFGCEQCGRRFSRQDTLSRHQTDGCRRKYRKTNRRSSTSDTQSESSRQSVPPPSIPTGRYI